MCKKIMCALHAHVVTEEKEDKYCCANTGLPLRIVYACCMLADIFYFYKKLHLYVAKYKCNFVG